MPDEREGLKPQALQTAQESSSLSDIEHGASVWKLAAEAEKNQAEATSQKCVLRQESLKSWAQILVPSTSVLTLGVPLLAQSELSVSLRDVARIVWPVESTARYRYLSSPFTFI
jgi:hypothetical protein